MLTEVFPYPYRVLSVNGIVTMADAFVCDAIKEILIEIQDLFLLANPLFLFKLPLSPLAFGHFLPYLQSIVVGYQR